MDDKQKALARKLLLGLGGVMLLALVGFGLWNFFFDRPPQFARQVAEDLPADSLGMVAFADPTRGLEILDNSMSDEIRNELEDEIGFDPFDESSYADMGLDLEAPVGMGVTDIDEPIFVFTMGIDDADKVRETLEGYADELGVNGLSERAFEGVEGLWLDSPPAAILFRGDRMIVVASEDADDRSVERAAEDIAEMRGRDSLAATAGFRQIHRFPGEPIMMMFANFDEIASNPMTKMTLGEVEVETLAFALTSDDRDIHFVVQTVFADDADYLRYARGVDRSHEALDYVSSPVYAGMHWKVDPEYLREVFDELGAFGKDELDDVSREFDRELGVSLERDVLAAWSGEFGVLWTNGGEDRWGGLAFVGVQNEDAAEELLETVWSRTEGEDQDTSDAGTLYRWGGRPPVVAKVWEERLWVGLGQSRLDQVDDEAKPFRKTTEVDAISDVVKSNSMGIFFVDLVELRGLLNSMPEVSSWVEGFKDVIEPLEALTVRSSVDGQTFTWTATLHTTVDEAFDTLLERLIEDLVAGAGVGPLLGGVPERSSCERAVDHTIFLMSVETPDFDTQQFDLVREKTLDQCRSGEIDPECVLAANTMNALAQCKK